MTDTHRGSKSQAIENMPIVCCDELAAVEFLETQRWSDAPCCVRCGSVRVYKMTDPKTGGRNRRFLWRCWDCNQQYTVRIGTVYEESRIPLRHWCHAFWRAAKCQNGVSALEIKRHCQISYKSALFLMNRIRFAMSRDPGEPKLQGTVECDEPYVGGKIRRGDDKLHRRGRGTGETPVFAVVERDGRIRRRVVADAVEATLKAALHEQVDSQVRIVTDEFTLTKASERIFGVATTPCCTVPANVRGGMCTQIPLGAPSRW